MSVLTRLDSLAPVTRSLPECARCHKTVDSVNSQDIYRGSRKLRRIWVRCHGQTDVVDVEHAAVRAIAAAGGEINIGGMAFAGPHALEIRGPDGMELRRQ